MTESVKRLEISYDDGVYRVVVDGVDVASDLYEVTVRCTAGEAPVVLVSRIVTPDQITLKSDETVVLGDGEVSNG